jgi:hypothetical protein
MRVRTGVLDTNDAKCSTLQKDEKERTIPKIKVRLSSSHQLDETVELIMSDDAGRN